ncbi:hypothetical protein HMJ29_11535 [Hymenobacter taeanensis]|uniref:Uncharacterized protein n=1 Tax=Hymenobacter taeanensis TaxID=2735321 RepID=A0A6M6BH53_9BACT|nr:MULTISPECIES: hypothetical protein [Hymenobacter]QJX47537.1 hypothetical protein HMJ29_11535 [Hymenobacter taeanensis]UOQ82978.1 hypothetical protein MUN83_09555 [Hymenobacter sp. 5414T-23]
MPLHRELDKKLSKNFEPSSRINDMFKGYNITLVTNEHGEPANLFFGKRRPDGFIVREWYMRTNMRQHGSLKVASSHWDLRGKILA